MVGSGPICTVSMPVRVMRPHVREAIASILAQSLESLEAVIVLHRADEATRSAIGAIAATDSRIRLVTSDAQTLPEARNAGVAAARGVYFAVLDSDDACHPQRLAEQVAFLRAHPQFAAVGSWAEIIDADGRSGGLIRTYAEVGFSTIFGLPRQPALIHSSLMCRTARLQAIGGYSPWFIAAHDQELLLRLAQDGRLGNIPRPLVRHRVYRDDDRVSLRHLRFQALGAVRLAQIVRCGAAASGPWREDPWRRLQAVAPDRERAFNSWLHHLLLIENKIRHRRSGRDDIRLFLASTLRATRRRAVRLLPAAFAMARVMRRGMGL